MRSTVFLHIRNPRTGWTYPDYSADLSLYPCPVIMGQAMGIRGQNRSHYWLEEGVTMTELLVEDKPPYRVPSVAEIKASPPLERKVVSLFSGAGGSSTGYRMAGFDVVWCNEFVEAARETYVANWPTTIVNGQDIRDVTPEQILAETGLKAGELDVLDGSPPCASFSTAGKRSKGWGKVSAYSDRYQRSDDLFFEYARILRGLQPKVFVAENVSGLVKGVAKGYFKNILAELKNCGYEVEARLLDAQWLGVPQQRQRIFFIGVRRDLAETYHVTPAFPKPLPYRYSVREALPWIFERYAGLEGANGFNHHQPRSVDRSAQTVQAGRPVRILGRRSRHDYPPSQDITDRPAKTVVVGDGDSTGSFEMAVEESTPRVVARSAGLERNTYPPQVDITDLPAHTVGARERAVDDMAVEEPGENKPKPALGLSVKDGKVRTPDDVAPTVQTHGNAHTRSEITVAVEPEPEPRVVHDTGGWRRDKEVTDEPAPTVNVGGSEGGGNSSHFLVEGDGNGPDGKPVRAPRVVHDVHSKTSWNSRKDITDTPSRAVTGTPAQYTVEEPEPESSLEGYAIEKEWEHLKPGETSERYFNLVRPDVDAASPTVTAIGGQSGGIASVTHPIERRKFTIQELKRICGFPDDYVLTGTYAQQWERCGRAVPPVMMRHIAETLRDRIFSRLSE